MIIKIGKVSGGQIVESLWYRTGNNLEAVPIALKFSAADLRAIFHNAQQAGEQAITIIIPKSLGKRPSEVQQWALADWPNDDGSAIQIAHSLPPGLKR